MVGGGCYLASRHLWCENPLGTGRIPTDTELNFSFFCLVLL